MLSGAEHHRPFICGDDRSGDLHLVHLVDLEEDMGHVLDRDPLLDDLVTGRLFLVAPDQRVDDSVESGREQQGLVPAVNVAKDPFDLGQEPHVGHPIRLVDHHLGHVGHRQVTSLDEIDSPSRCANREVDAVAEMLDLLLDGIAAVDGSDADAACMGCTR